MKRISCFCLIVILFAVSCSNKNDFQNEKLRNDLSTFFVSNLNDSSVLLDSFYLLKIDTITEHMKLSEQFLVLSNQQKFLLELLKNKTDELSLISDKIQLYRMIGSQDLVNIEMKNVEENQDNFKLLNTEIDSLRKVLISVLDTQKKADTVKPVAFQAKCLYQIRNKDKSIKRDTAYIILNLNKDIVIRKDFLNLPYVFDYDKFD
jgi:uncharacterized protein with NAD-binding domain and iron-sulfur cluster